MHHPEKTGSDLIEVDPKVEPASDKLYRMAEGAASLLPGGSAIFKTICMEPVQKRVLTWIDQATTKLQELENREVISFNELAKRPEFSAILLKVIQEVEITSQEEKLVHLRNFVVNLALRPSEEEDELHILTGIIKELTPSHVKLLLFYNDPSQFIEEFEKFLQRQFNFIGVPYGQDTPFSYSYPGDEIANLFLDTNLINLVNSDKFSVPEYEYWDMTYKKLATMHLVQTNRKLHALEINNDGTSVRFNVSLTSSLTHTGSKILSMLMSGL